MHGINGVWGLMRSNKCKRENQVFTWLLPINAPLAKSCFQIYNYTITYCTSVCIFCT